MSSWVRESDQGRQSPLGSRGRWAFLQVSESHTKKTQVELGADKVNRLGAGVAFGDGLACFPRVEICDPSLIEAFLVHLRFLLGA